MATEQPPVAVAVAVVAEEDPPAKAQADGSKKPPPQPESCFDRFVLCIVNWPMLIIAITISVSFIIAIITIIAISTTGSAVGASLCADCAPPRPPCSD
eukprot:SAG31_NODE_1451_length_8305_cov_8.321350_2_plen_98_part_00